ncbi:MAG: nuclear transport factor 2 family protein [Pseudomonadota bacterium]
MMRALLAAAALAAAVPATAQDADVAELTAVADRFDQAQIAQDGPVLEAMVADGLIFLDGGGARLGKRDFIAGWLDATVKFEPITIAGRYVIPLGPDSGVAGGEVVLRGTAGGQPFASHIRFADTFRRIGGKWQAVHIQVTRIPAK